MQIFSDKQYMSFLSTQRALATFSQCVKSQSVKLFTVKFNVRAILAMARS